VQIIPVIDLMKNIVVHAKKGRRDSYKPIQTPLCQGSSPHAVIDGLLGLHEFKTRYIADLDALMGLGDHGALLSRLQQDYPGLQFWIDRGLPPSGLPQPGLNSVPVIGSESLVGERLGLLKTVGRPYILSLDFMGEGLLGESNLLEDSGLWPDTVIIMSLSCVGANEGPDFQRLEKFRRQRPEKNIIAAGGARNAKDLNRLDELGVGGVLLASALHSGALDPSVLLGHA
jgi:phosphoribosylformimino-5-aminoimidazole carboxamide ribotide isomerase